jgi:apolipoprotein N-acyltransferase
MNLGLSILTAALLLLAFPPYGQAWVAAFALAPLLYACARESSWKARLVNGWIAFTIYWLFHCIWIEFVLDVHGGMGFWGGWGAFLLFALAKGLHTGLFALFAGWLSNRWWSLPAIAALWTGIERTQKYDGFTWLQLGNAGINMPLPMRLAPITGVYGLSFVFAMLGCAVAVMALRRSRKELAWLLVLAILLVLPRLPRPAEPSEKALVVQPNVDTETRWTRNTLVDTEIDLQRLSRGAGASLLLSQGLGIS